MKNPIPIVVAVALACAMPVQAAKVFITPDRAIEVAAAKLKAGDTLILKKGVYRQSATLYGLRGEADRPIVIRGEPGVIIEPVERDGILIMGEDKTEYLVIEGLTVRGAKRAGIMVNSSKHVTIRHCIMADNRVWGIQAIMSDHITVEDCELSGSKEQHGVYFSTTDPPVVRRCRIHANAGCGAHFNGDVTEGGDGMIMGAIVVDSIFYGNGKTGGSAINMDGVAHARILNNLIFNNRSGGITSFKGNGIRAGDEHVIENNTVWFAPKAGRFAIQVLGNVTNVAIVRNVLVAGRGPVLEVSDAAVGGIHGDYNVYFMRGTGNVIDVDGRRMDLAAWQELTRRDARSLTLNPEFTNPGNSNFTITAKLPRDWPAVGYQAK